MLSEPDFSPIIGHLTALYGELEGYQVFERLRGRIEKHRFSTLSTPGTGLTQRDSILITYGDQVQTSGQQPLHSLANFCRRWLDGVVSGIHILPFFPFSSDDGFSVIDFRQVDSVLGSWQDIARLGEHFRLMFDLVLNHVSAQSAWFQGFLQQKRPYRDYFITVEDQPDLSQVFRPRTHPLLTHFETPTGRKAVWTTFSADQIDLNYQNPDVLVEMIDTLFYYVAHGAEFIRLDAVAFLWKEIGTRCLHLPQAHHIVQIFRSLLDIYAPWVHLITETNVPHLENVSYFGDGTNEAHMVYNFALPPLILHTFHTGDASAISRWAANLSLPSKKVTFFNFLASHDGIGVTPARGLIPPAAINSLVEKARYHGGLVSYRTNPDGTKTPYELNINYFDALSGQRIGESMELQAKRFLAAHAILLALVGVPGIYFHSLFGSRGWLERAIQTGHNRTINRQKLLLAALERELAEQGTLREAIYRGLKHLLKLRASEPAFHPFGDQRVLDFGRQVFAIQRTGSGGDRAVLCLTNVTTQTVEIGMKQGDGIFSSARQQLDLLTSREIAWDVKQNLTLDPYQTLWLTNSPSEIDAT